MDPLEQVTGYLQMIQNTISKGESMGIAFNREKSCFVPSQTLKWLGMSWDTEAESEALSDEHKMLEENILGSLLKKQLPTDSGGAS